MQSNEVSTGFKDVTLLSYTCLFNMTSLSMDPAGIVDPLFDTFRSKSHS